MGTHITTQKRGHGSKAYSTPGFHYYANVSYPNLSIAGTGQVLEFIDDPGRFPLLAKIVMQDGKTEVLNIASEGLKVGDRISVNESPKDEQGTFKKYDYQNLRVGTIVALGNLPEGTPIFNIERSPMDGGKFARSSGSYGSVVAHDEDTENVTIRLASKKIVVFDPRCRATIGVACGAGRLEKPLLKAGYAHYFSKGRNRLYPKVRGTAMSAYDHPFGGRGFGKAKTVNRDTPPGRKVGLIAAKRTGKSKGKRKKQETL